MKKIELSIPKPCHEKWNEMSPGNGGRFCGACNKTVIDFSQMTDRELLDFFKKPAGSVCGHFNQFQLDRTIVSPKKQLPWARYFFTITIPAFLLSLKASAQGEIRIRGKVAVTEKTSKEICKDTTSESTKIETLSGKVVDEQGLPMQNVSILLEGTSIGTTTNMLGVFELKHKVADDGILIISSVGFEIRKISVAELKKNTLQVLTLKAAWMGEVVVTGVVVRKAPKPFPLMPPANMESRFTKFSVYPNPIASNAAFSIDAKKLDAGNYLLQIANSGGEIVQSTEVVIDKMERNLSSQLSAFAAGPYFIRLVNKKNNKAYTEIIIVQ
jgi:hypothetical protein